MFLKRLGPTLSGNQFLKGTGKKSFRFIQEGIVPLFGVSQCRQPVGDGFPANGDGSYGNLLCLQICLY